MKNLQKKGWMKAVAWLLVVICGFGFAFTAGLGLVVYGYYNGSGYRIYWDQESQYRNMAWREFELIQNPAETAQERKEQQRDIEDLEEQLKNSGFYFEIWNMDTDEVLLSNLPDESYQEYLYGWEEPGVAIEEPVETGVEEGDTGSAQNPVCYAFNGNGALVPVYTYSNLAGVQSDPEYEYYDLYVEGGDGLIYHVYEISGSPGSYTVRYDLGWTLNPYDYDVELRDDGTNCYLQQMNGDFLSSPLTEENRATILNSIGNGSVYVKVGDEYYLVNGYDDSGLIYEIPYGVYKEAKLEGTMTTGQETSIGQEQISDLAAVYYRLKNDGTLEYLNMMRTADVQQALENGTLYVVYTDLGGENQLCQVVSRIEGGTCVYDTNSQITAELPQSSGGTVGANCYQRTEGGQLELVTETDMITLLNLCYGNLLFTLNDRGEPVRVTGVEQREDGIYFGYQNYDDGVVIQRAPVVSEEPAPEPETSETEENPDSYYISYGIGPVEGVTTVFDEYENAKAQMQGYLPQFVAMAVAFGLADLLGVIWLCFASGHRKGKEEITLNWFDRIWLDLLLVLYVVAAALMLLLAQESVFYGAWMLYPGTITTGFLIRLGIAALWCVLAEVGTLWILLTIITRIKARVLFKNLLVVRILKWAWKVVSGPFRRLHLRSRVKKFWGIMQKNLKLAAKVGLVYALFALLDFICAVQYGMSAGMLFLWILIHLAALAAVEYWCISFDAIRKGVARLNQGEMEAQIDTKGMPYDLKAVAEQLNNLSEGINRAVEKQMQSERFKAELITNVSHDLKTPLTSIINYIDLLKQTNITDPKALEYLEVLDRKSQRLKKLTEDLVEASKASTGAMKVEKRVLDFGQLVSQALGEYDEKLQSAQLRTVYQPPEEPLLVLGDGRHLWRVLDNLLNNCVKYAMPGTRVYLILSRGEGFVTLEMKNISAEPLNLTAEELMERFVRGDSSRSTEGSGLGLNIAMNLMELQGGTFRLSIDGDLFKAIITIPQAE